MNVRNGIPIEIPSSQHRNSTRTVEGKREEFNFYKGKMIEMFYRFKDGREGSLIMPARQEWIEEYLKDGWRIRARWVAR